MSQDQIKARFPVSKRAKQVKKAFKTVLKEVTLEILSDGDDQVAVEGISILAEYDYLFQKSSFEDELKPRLEDILSNAIDSRISVCQQARLSRLQGPILHRLDSLGLLSQELTEQLFHFFCICLKEPVVIPTEQSSFPDNDEIGITIKEYYHNKQLDSQSVLQCAVFNLPCFYKILGHRVHTKPASKQKNQSQKGATMAQLMTQRVDVRKPINLTCEASEEHNSSTNRSVTSRDTAQTGKKVVLYNKEIEKMALELSQEDKPFEIRRTLAASYHELLAHKKDMQSFKRLDKLLANFLQDSMLKESGVQTMICKNLGAIVGNYFTNIRIKDVVSRILLVRRARQTGLNPKELVRHRKRQSFVETSDADPFKIHTIETIIDRTVTRQSSSLTRNASHKSTLFQGADEVKADDFMADKLFQFVPKEQFPEDKLDEVAYSRLLDHLVLLFDKIIISQGGSRRDCELFLRNIIPVMHLFNPIELQDYFVEKIDALITFACDYVRSAAFCFLAKLLSIQYRRELRNVLIQKIKEYVYVGSTISQRKNFILFCTESIKVNNNETDGLFEKCFFPYFLKLGFTDKNYALQISLIKALPVIRNAIVESGDGNMLLKLNQMISEMKHMQDLHPEVFRLLFAVCSDFKTDVEKQRIVGMASINLEARRIKASQHIEALDQREQFERDARKKMAEEREITSIQRKRRLNINSNEKPTKKSPDKSKIPSPRKNQVTKESQKPQSVSINDTQQIEIDSTTQAEADASQSHQNTQAKPTQAVVSTSLRQASTDPRPLARPTSASQQNRFISSPGHIRPSFFYTLPKTEAQIENSESQMKSKSKGQIIVDHASSKAQDNSSTTQWKNSYSQITSPMRKRLLMKAVSQTDASMAEANNDLIQGSNHNSARKFIAKSNTRVEVKRKIVVPQNRYSERNDLANFLQDGAINVDKTGKIQLKEETNNIPISNDQNENPDQSNKAEKNVGIKIVASPRKTSQQQSQEDQAPIIQATKYKITSPRVKKQSEKSGGQKLLNTMSASRRLNKDLRDYGVAIPDHDNGHNHNSTSPSQIAQIIKSDRSKIEQILSSPPSSSSTAVPSTSSFKQVLKNSSANNQQVGGGRNKVMAAKSSKTVHVVSSQGIPLPFTAKLHTPKGNATQITSSVLSSSSSSSKRQSNAQSLKLLSNLTTITEGEAPQSRQKHLQNGSVSVKHQSNNSVLFDHFACSSEPKKSVILGSNNFEDKRNSAVTIKLKGIIQSKRTSVGGGLNLTGNAPTTTQKRSLSKKWVPLIPKRSGRSSCNSSPGRKRDSMLAPSTSIKRQSTPKRQTVLKANNLDLIMASPVDYQSDLYHRGGAAQAFTQATVKMIADKTPRKRSRNTHKQISASKQKESQQPEPADIIIFNSPGHKQSQKETTIESAEFYTAPSNQSLKQHQEHQGPCNTQDSHKRSIYEPDEEPADPTPVKESLPTPQTNQAISGVPNYKQLSEPRSLRDDQTTILQNRRLSATQITSNANTNIVSSFNLQATPTVIVKTTNGLKGISGTKLAQKRASLQLSSHMHKKQGSMGTLPSENMVAKATQQAVIIQGSSTFTKRANSLANVNPVLNELNLHHSHTIKQAVKTKQKLQTTRLVYQPDSTFEQSGSLTTKGRKKQRSNNNSQNTSQVINTPAEISNGYVTRTKQSRDYHAKSQTFAANGDKSDDVKVMVKQNSSNSVHKRKARGSLNQAMSSGPLNLSSSHKTLYAAQDNIKPTKSPNHHALTSKRSSFVLSDFAKSQVLQDAATKPTLPPQHQSFFTRHTAAKMSSKPSKSNGVMLADEESQSPNANNAQSATSPHKRAGARMNRVPSKSFISRQTVHTQNHNSAAVMQNASNSNNVTQQNMNLMLITAAQKSPNASQLNIAAQLQQAQVQKNKNSSNQGTAIFNNAMSFQQLIMKKAASHKQTILQNNNGNNVKE